ERFSSISFHVYRLPEGGGAASPATVAIPTAPAVPVKAGAMAEVVADGDCLRVRGSANLASPVLTCVATGAQVRVLELGPSADGYRWVRVTSGAVAGWAAERYLLGVAGAS